MNMSTRNSRKFRCHPMVIPMNVHTCISMTRIICSLSLWNEMKKRETGNGCLVRTIGKRLGHPLGRAAAYASQEGARCQLGSLDQLHAKRGRIAILTCFYRLLEVYAILPRTKSSSDLNSLYRCPPRPRA